VSSQCFDISLSLTSCGTAECNSAQCFHPCNGDIEIYASEPISSVTNLPPASKIADPILTNSQLMSSNKRDGYTLIEERIHIVWCGCYKIFLERSRLVVAVKTGVSKMIIAKKTRKKYLHSYVCSKLLQVPTFCIRASNCNDLPCA
jgi:hypothetical protein